MKRIMIVDDDTSLSRTLELYFQGKNYDVSVFRTGRAAFEHWREEDPDLILLDVQLPDMEGPEVLEKAKREALAGEVVMITAFHDTEATLKAIRLGAADYLYKPIDLDALDLLLGKLLLQKAERERQVRLSHVVSPSHKPNQIIGRSKAMLEVIKAIAQVAQTPASVLLEGETGTGKELVAQAIHQESASEDPFVALNCAAIVENLLESELFGHERGAFTGATHRKIGKLEIAGEGTVFLDEIGEFPLELQAKLLRVLQEREFQRVGGLKNVPMHARIIAATNRNLEAMIKEGAFREDLYFRLKVFVIPIPPLRDRTEDIVPLTEYFIHLLNREMGKKVSRIPHAHLEALRSYDWPGNVRELQNVLRRGMILSKGELLDLNESWMHKEDLLRGMPEKALRLAEEEELQSLAEIERVHIMKVLKRTRGNYGEACRVLGISRPTLRRKISEYSLLVELED
ncbi:MAG TPA: sigma-54 dependent transcriptional regulator [Syntrophobacteraceae bacterium]|nr:sigma-54 dependent transcriptional regulator [Syntrophobacteraceae bacterium]